MKITLSEALTKRLLDMPETGMGYQRVDIVFDDGTVLPGAIVLNASVVDVPDSMANKKICDFRISCNQ